MKKYLTTINKLSADKFVLIGLTLISCAIAWLFWQQDSLSIYDASGHVAAVESMRNFWPLLSGWNSKELLGFPQGMFYPSMFHYLAASLSFLIGVGSAIRVLISLALIALPLTIFLFTKSFIKDSYLSMLATVLLFALIVFLPDYLGGGVRSAFRVGLLSSFFVMPLLFLFGSRLAGVLSGKFLAASLLLALLIVTHLVAGLVAGFFLITFVLGDSLIKKNLRLINLLKVIILGAALSSFFWLPFLVFRQYTSITNPEISSYLLPNLIGFIVATVLLLVGFRKKQQPLFITALASSVLLAAVLFDALATKLFGFRSISHSFYLFRFQPFAYIFLITALIVFVSSIRLGSRTLVTRALVCAFGLLIAGLIIKNPASVQKAQVNLETDKKISGRFLESFRRLQTFPAYYELQTKLNNANPKAAWVNGLFAESAANSPYVSSLIKGLHPDLYPEGEGALLETKFIDPDRVNSTLDLFAVNWLINLEDTRKNIVATWSKGGEIKYYNLKEVSQKPVFEVTSLNLVPVTSQWNQAVQDWWLQKGPIKELPYLTAGEKLKAKKENLSSADLKIVEVNPSGTRYHLKVSATKKVPVFAKISYFPSWKASSGGEDLKIYRVAPSLMLFEGEGDIVLEYRMPTVQVVGYLVSAAALLVFLVLAYKKRNLI